MLPYDLEPKKIEMFLFIFLIIIEQPFYWLKGSYVYRYGILVNRLNLNEIPWHILKQSHRKLSLKSDNNYKEIYLHNKYQAASLGFLIFVAQIQYNKEIKMNIRIGPLTALFLILLMSSLIIKGGHNRLASILAIAGVVYIDHNIFFRNIMNIIYKKM
ncbi:MAG: hypothetical protein R2941_01740 [Desulfobacterales bacterium]